VSTLWLDPSFGASGDMLLGALVGVGADPDRLRDLLAALPVEGWSLATGTVTRCGLSASRIEVLVHDRHEHGDREHHDLAEAHAHHGRSWSGIDAMLARAELPAAVTEGARRTFRLLGEIEAAAHDVPIDDVHFHEVGAVDAIVDIVGVWAALHLLHVDHGVDHVVVGPVGLGHGTVRGAHGLLPLPAPATAALLAGAPVRPVDVEMETCTPTGAALLATIGTWGAMPAGTLIASARGAGGRDPAGHPNVTVAHVVDPVAAPGVEHDAPGAAPGAQAHPAVLLATNVDDVTPEVIGHLIDLLIAGGADDAWVTPIVMKKSRPAFQLSVLCAPPLAAELRTMLSAETGTLGIRESTVTKHVQPRHVETVEVDGTSVRVKVGPHGVKPEHDDLVALRRVTGRPLRDLAAEVVRRVGS
jgi:uncharacterized protein (TIGR00299 family) protein